MNHQYATTTEALNAPERPSEVQEQIARIISVTEYIDKITEELEEMLGRSILAQRKAQATGELSPEPVRVPLAESLNARANHLELIRERLSSILDRLEA